MIPKRIFYVWCGGCKTRMAEICIENWRLMLPDFDIIEINENTVEWFDFQKEYANNLWFKTVYDLKMWAYVSDYMRVKVLYDHGGVYLDTDVTVYKDFSPLLNHKMFVNVTKANVVEFAIVGSERKSSILGRILDFYSNGIWNSKLFVIGTILDQILRKELNLFFDDKKIYDFEAITVYPSKYFSPLLFNMSFTSDLVALNTYSVHWQSNSWMSKKNLYFLSNKHKVPLKVLLRQLDFIEKNDVNANNKILIGDN